MAEPYQFLPGNRYVGGRGQRPIAVSAERWRTFVGGLPNPAKPASGAGHSGDCPGPGGQLYESASAKESDSRCTREGGGDGGRFGVVGLEWDAGTVGPFCRAHGRVARGRVPRGPAADFATFADGSTTGGGVLTGGDDLWSRSGGDPPRILGQGEFPSVCPQAGLISWRTAAGDLQIAEFPSLRPVRTLPGPFRDGVLWCPNGKWGVVARDTTWLHLGDIAMDQLALLHVEGLRLTMGWSYRRHIGTSALCWIDCAGGGKERLRGLEAVVLAPRGA
jgi:hypothetical protein